MGAPKPWRSAGRWMTPNRAALGRLDCIAYHGGSLAMPVLAAQDSKQCRSFLQRDHTITSSSALARPAAPWHRFEIAVKGEHTELRSAFIRLLHYVEAEA